EVQSSYRQVSGSLRAVAGNETRIRVRQNVSKRIAATGFKIVICTLARAIEFPGQDVSFDLVVPLLGLKIGGPPREECEFIRRQTQDDKFKLFNAHVLNSKVGL